MKRRRKKVLIWISLNGGIKAVLIAAAAILVVFLFQHDKDPVQTWDHFAMPLSGKTIALDAGHGGPDGGAVSKSGVLEKDINLSIVLLLRDYLQQAGAVVVLTRDADTDLASPGTKGLSRRKTEDLHARADMIRRHHADMLISVHLNSILSSRWHGAQTFYYPGRADSKKLAVLIQQQIKTNLKNTDRAANTQSTFYLFKALSIPSALVEIGFLSNPQEARMMVQQAYQKKMADSIYEGILRYYSEGTSKSG